VVPRIPLSRLHSRKMMLRLRRLQAMYP